MSSGSCARCHTAGDALGCSLDCLHRNGILLPEELLSLAVFVDVSLLGFNVSVLSFSNLSCMESPCFAYTFVYSCKLHSMAGFSMRLCAVSKEDALSVCAQSAPLAFLRWKMANEE